MRRLVVAFAVMALMMIATASSAQGPMVTIDLDCEGIGHITVESNPRYLWVPGHVSSENAEVTHIVTSIFGFEKGQAHQKLPSGTILCTVDGGPLDGTEVYGFFTPVGGPPT